MPDVNVIASNWLCCRPPVIIVGWRSTYGDGLRARRTRTDDAARRNAGNWNVPARPTGSAPARGATPLHVRGLQRGVHLDAQSGHHTRTSLVITPCATCAGSTRTASGCRGKAARGSRAGTARKLRRTSRERRGGPNYNQGGIAMRIRIHLASPGTREQSRAARGAEGPLIAPRGGQVQRRFLHRQRRAANPDLRRAVNINSSQRRTGRPRRKTETEPGRVRRRLDSAVSVSPAGP